MGSSFKTETINLPTLGHVDVRVTALVTMIEACTNTFINFVMTYSNQ